MLTCNSLKNINMKLRDIKVKSMVLYLTFIIGESEFSLFHESSLKMLHVKLVYFLLCAKKCNLVDKFNLMKVFI